MTESSWSTPRRSTSSRICLALGEPARPARRRPKPWAASAIRRAASAVRVGGSAGTAVLSRTSGGAANNILRRASLDRRPCHRTGHAVRLGGRQRGQPVRGAGLRPAGPARPPRPDHRALTGRRAGPRHPAGDPQPARRPGRRRHRRSRRAGGGRGAAVLPDAAAGLLAAGGRGPHDRGGAERAVARRRQRARAVRAERLERGPAPFARAERRQLPCADRADPLDAAHAAAVAAAVRPPGRADRQLPGHPQPAAALLPRRLPGDPPGGRRRRAPDDGARCPSW